MATKLQIRTSDGEIVLEIVEGESVVAGTRMQGKDAGLFAAALLDCARALGAKQSPQASEEPKFLPLRPSTITLGPTPEPNSQAMVFAFGDARIGVSISQQNLTAIGEGFLALGADKKLDSAAIASHKKPAI